MKARCLEFGLLVAVICACGCSKGRQQAASSESASGGDPGAALAQAAGQPASGSDADAIRAAIEDHVRNDHSINMDVMTMSVDSVSVNGDQARAQAAFHLKQGGTGMAMMYFLARQGNGWVVMRSQPSDGQLANPSTDEVHSGMPANPDQPPMPDVTDFLKNHPSNGKN